MTTPGRGGAQHGGQSISIGLRDLYDQLQELTRAYTSLSAKIDTALISQTMAQQSIAQQLADLRHDLTDHEARIRAQEAKVYITPRAMWGGIGVIATVLGVLFTVFTMILSR